VAACMALTDCRHNVAVSRRHFASAVSMLRRRGARATFFSLEFAGLFLMQRHGCRASHTHETSLRENRPVPA